MSEITYKSDTFENYEAYRKIARDRMTLEEAEQIFTEYYDSLDLTEEYFHEEYRKLVSHAIRYAGIRAKWACLDLEEKIREDSSRTMVHDMLVNDVSRYAGYLKRTGKEAHWFELLGQGIEPENVKEKRKRIGDWGCFIALFVALNQR